MVIREMTEVLAVCKRRDKSTTVEETINTPVEETTTDFSTDENDLKG
jgi:hypothetical protein